MRALVIWIVLSAGACWGQSRHNYKPPSDCKSWPEGLIWAGEVVYDRHGCPYPKTDDFVAPKVDLMPAPLKCGKYEHEDHSCHGHSMDACIDIKGHCDPDLHMVTEYEWQDTQKKISCLQEWVQRTVLHKFNENMNDCASMLKPETKTPTPSYKPSLRP